MDKNVVDELSLQEIPYYQQQLVGALQILLQMQNEIEQLETDEDSIVVKTLEDNGHLYQPLEDVDVENIDYVIRELQDKHMEELEQLDEMQKEQDELIFILNQQLDTLTEEKNILLSKQDGDMQNVTSNLAILTQKQNELYSLKHEQFHQEQQNKHTQQLIKKQQKANNLFKQEIDEKLLLRQKKEEEKKICKHKKQQSLYSEVMKLIQDKEQLQEAIQDYLRKQEAIVNELQYKSDVTPDTKEEYLQEAQKLSIKSFTEELSQHLTQEQKKRACCGQCTIF